MSPLAEYVLRTLASVPPGCRVLDLESGDGTITVALAQLGFDLHATSTQTEHALRVQRAVHQAQPSFSDRVITAAPHALGYPDNFFDWVVALGSYDAIETDRLADALSETRRVLTPGGWVIVAVQDGADVTPEWLTYRMKASGFAVAESPKRTDDERATVIRGIYRKVDAHSVG